jgi:hypothetical protein
MTKKELAQILEIMIKKAKENQKRFEHEGATTESNYQRGKIDAYEIILHSLTS